MDVWQCLIMQNCENYIERNFSVNIEYSINVCTVQMYHNIPLVLMTLEVIVPKPFEEKKVLVYLYIYRYV
jgi:hypothetical protein